MSRSASLFDRIPRALLTPLGGPLAPTYWRVLERLYELEFEREPLYVTRAMALDHAEDVVIAAGPQVLDVVDVADAAAADDDVAAALGVEDERTERVVGARLLRRLERTGWFQYEYRAEIGEVLSFAPAATRILEVLVRVARDEQPVFQGYAHSIATLLQKESFAARPGVVLIEARRHTLDLVRELKILDRNIHGFVQRILADVGSASAVLEESFEVYRRAVMGNYHRLKTVDNLFKWRAGILLRLDDIERDSLSLASAARWMAEELQLDDVAAAARVAADLALLRAEFEKLPVLIDSIDTRNARFSGSTLRKLMYLLRHDRRIEGQLQLLLEKLGADDAPDVDVDVFRCELLGEGFLYAPPKRRARAERQKITRRGRAEVDAVKAQVAPRLLQRRNARPRIEELVALALAGRREAELDALPMNDDDDYVAAIFATAFGLDGASSYVVEPLGRQRVRRGRYTIPRARIVGGRRRR
jgi:hypothetical protein